MIFIFCFNSKVAIIERVITTFQKFRMAIFSAVSREGVIWSLGTLINIYALVWAAQTSKNPKRTRNLKNLRGAGVTAGKIFAANCKKIQNICFGSQIFGVFEKNGIKMFAENTRLIKIIVLNSTGEWISTHSRICPRYHARGRRWNLEQSF